LDYRKRRAGKTPGVGEPLRGALARDEGFSLEGVLASFESEFNPTTGTLGVHGVFPNPGGLLLPGMFVRVRMPLGGSRPVLEVPDAAVLSDQGRKYVLLVNDRGV